MGRVDIPNSVIWPIVAALETTSGRQASHKKRLNKQNFGKKTKKKK